MNKARKILSIVTIASTAIVSLLLILLLFHVDFLGAYKAKIYVTFGALAIGGFFAINSFNMILKNKVIGWVSFGLIAGSVLLIMFCFWANLSYSTFVKFVMAIGLLSVLFNIIVSSGLDLGKSLLVLQIIVYVFAGIVDVISTLAIFGVVDLTQILAIFLTLIIITLVGIVVLKVLAKKRISTEIQEEKDMIKVSKQDYVTLVEKAKKYDELMAKNENHEN